MRNGIEVSYFIPFKLSSDVCGDNGLPVCPNATRILGVGKRQDRILIRISRPCPLYRFNVVLTGTLTNIHSTQKKAKF